MMDLMPMMVSSARAAKDMTLRQYLARIQNEYPDRFLSMLWTNPIEISFLKGLGIY